MKMQVHHRNAGSNQITGKLGGKEQKTMSTHWKAVLSMAALVVVVVGAFLAPASAIAAGDWYAEYYANRTLSGGPTLTRYEADLHHEWGTGSPGTGIPADGFSARFSQDIWFSTGTYRFSYRSDDGLRVWVDNVLVIDAWRDQSAVWYSVDQYVPGGVHRVRVEYYEATGTAALQLGWDRLAGGDVWTATFWNNTTLSGDSVHGRGDTAIDFDWGTGSPDAKVSADQFSARWARTLGFQAGTYRFYAAADDGVRVYVDGRRVVDAWTTQKLPNTHYGDIALAAGNHTVVIDYYEQGGEAAIHVWWNRLDQLQGWEGRYFDNRDLRGGPAMIRDDAEINFDWGDGPPASWMPSDNFSVRWTRTINFTPGLYRFNSRSDDGIRLWIDDVDLKLNHWETQTYTWHYQDWHWLEGPHTLRVEYFDGTGAARVQFWWDYAATAAAAQATPPTPTYHAGTTPAPASPRSPTTTDEKGPWQGAYYASRTLTGTPVFVRTDPAIKFDWRWGSPDSRIPVDNFAVRWTGTFNFEGGRYRFKTMTDDGVRVYVDDDLVIGHWYRMRGTRYVTYYLAPGEHTIRMDYFEATQAATASLNWERVSQ
jgi:hypothetical protein